MLNLPTIEVRRAIVDELDITTAEFLHGRTKQAVIGRQLFMYALIHYNGASVRFIAEYLGMRPSTVVRGLSKIETLDDPQMVAIVQKLRDVCAGKPLPNKSKSARIISINNSHPQGG